MVRIAAAAYHARLLGARSHIYLSDFIGLETRAAYATLYARNGMLAPHGGGNSGPCLAALLPPHLQTSAGVGSISIKRDKGAESNDKHENCAEVNDTKKGKNLCRTLTLP